jgi:YfiH family protein
LNERSWRLDHVEGLVLVRCAALEAIDGIAHAFSTRRTLAGAEFDLGASAEATLELAARRRMFLRAAGLAAAQPAILRQVHGCTIVTASESSDAPPTADGVIRVLDGDGGAPAPAIRTADCVPVLVADREAGVVGAVHAGWRGIAAGIGSSAVSRFAAEGFPAGRLVVALGPAIRGCCYEVGEEVVAALDAACGANRAHVATDRAGVVTVDLHAALRAQLAAAGVPPASIHGAPWCTCCRTDLFFSFRAERRSAGRSMAVIGPAARP